MDIEELIKVCIDSAYEVHQAFLPGYAENVYKRALKVELEYRGIPVEKEVKIKVQYRGKDVGCFKADLVVDGRIIMELKAKEMLVEAHKRQLANYLQTTGIEDGLLINFGEERIKIIRRSRTFDPDRYKKP
ncbi:MAG: GxxExxY protein [Bacteroidales bacterium]|nr:GxxExxY protein [Bacteroidales bacterium]